jgi:hypothetical protein
MTRAPQTQGRQKVTLPASEQTQRGPWAKTPDSYFHGHACIQAVDILAHEMDKKWGVDRLRLLVGPDLQARFDTQRWKLNEAIEKAGSEQIQLESQRTVNAYRALDKAATESGADMLDPKMLEIHQVDGKVLCVVQTHIDASRVKNDGRAKVVVSLVEIVALLEHYQAAVDVLAAFPGARVTSTRRLDDPVEGIKWQGLIDDEIPF